MIKFVCAAAALVAVSTFAASLLDGELAKVSKRGQPRVLEGRVANSAAWKATYDEEMEKAAKDGALPELKPTDNFERAIKRISEQSRFPSVESQAKEKLRRTLACIKYRLEWSYRDEHHYDRFVCKGYEEALDERAEIRAEILEPMNWSGLAGFDRDTEELRKRREDRLKNYDRGIGEKWTERDQANFESFCRRTAKYEAEIEAEEKKSRADRKAELKAALEKDADAWANNAPREKARAKADAAGNAAYKKALKEANKENPASKSKKGKSKKKKTATP